MQEFQVDDDASKEHANSKMFQPVLWFFDLFKSKSSVTKRPQ